MRRRMMMMMMIIIHVHKHINPSLFSFGAWSVDVSKSSHVL